MSEYIRLITKNENEINLKNIEEILKNTDMVAEVINDKNGNWEKIVVKREDTNQLVTAMTRAENISEEKQMLEKDIIVAKPSNAAEWVKKYLTDSKKIYKFEILEGAEDQYGWYTLESIREAVWEDVEGILQNDGEGYRNEEGFFILWQFEYEELEGPYESAVMDKKGKWQCFEMELSDEEHISQFKEGKVPQGLEILEF